MEKIILALLLVVGLIGKVNADESTDSLIFTQKRKKILEEKPSERSTLMLSAAEDLARDGYYSEALDLIFGLEDSAATANLSETFLSDTNGIDSPSFSAAKPVKSIPFSGYIQTSADYEDWEYQDQPWGGRIKAKVDWLHANQGIEKLSAVVQTSDHSVYFDFYQKANLAGRMLKIESEELIEKKIRQSYGDSLDRIYLDLWAEANSRPLGKPISLALPLRLVAEQFRSEKINSFSSRQIWAQPRVEAVSDDLRKSLILGWELRNKIYPRSARDNNFSQGPVAWGEWYGDRINASAETHYLKYNFTRDTSLIAQSELETKAEFFVRTWQWMKMGMQANGGSEINYYNDSLDLINTTRILSSYRLEGSKWNVIPQIVFEWAGTYSITLSLLYERGKYPTLGSVNNLELSIPRSLYTPYNDWQPSVGFTMIAKTIFLNMSMDYETNTVPASNLYNIGSSKGVRFNGNVFWKLNSWLEFDLTSVITKEIDPKTTPRRVQDYTSISIGFTSNF